VSEAVPFAKRLEVVSYDAQGLGDRSYLVHDGDKAVVVDPQRDPGPYLATADNLGADITLVLETHLHNDYVSGGAALARRAKATYGVPSGEPMEPIASSEPLDEGDVLKVGELALTVLSTPGHTPHHLCFFVEDAQGTKVALTGGSLLEGGTGRTDLFGAEPARGLAEAQWRSVRRLLSELPPATVVLPTHGFGSFCSSAPSPVPAATELTIGAERQDNPAALLDVDAFIATLESEALPVPAYYRYMAPLNRAGAGEPCYGPLTFISTGSLPETMGRGTVVVDIRPRRVFADAHLPGSLNIELGANISTYLGWLVPADADFVIVARTLEEVAEARRLLARIGRETPDGWARADIATIRREGRHGRYDVHDFRDLGERRKAGVFPHVLDVRFPYEWQKGHIKAARNVPLPEIGSASLSLSRNEEIWVHCSAGYRAAIAASVLSGQGLFPVLVDDLFDNAPGAGLEIVTE
jgi:hydroxyacylglutathione hydrolase